MQADKSLNLVRVSWCVAVALLLLAGCNGGPVVAENAPEQILGLWEARSGDSSVYLLFMQDGEFRSAFDSALLYDAPLFIGRYLYQGGRLTLVNGGLESTACRDSGEYVITKYQAEPEPQLTLAASRDECPDRLELLPDITWQQAAVEG